MEFVFPIAESGDYEAALWYSADGGRASNVPVEVVHAGGTALFTVNQRIDGAAWLPLGTLPFQAGTEAIVRISNVGTDGFVVADAARLRRVQSQTGSGPGLASAAAFATPTLATVVTEIRISTLKRLDDAFEVSWPTTAGTVYDLHQTSEPTGAWSVVDTVIGTGKPVTVTVPFDLGEDGRLFLRIETRPAAVTPPKRTSAS